VVNASHKIAEQAYKTDSAGAQNTNEEKPNEEEVVDAEVEEEDK